MLLSLPLIFLLSTLCHISLANPQAKRRAKVLLSSAEDVGIAHYTIIDNLKSSLEQKLPLNSHEFMHMLSTELRDSLCNEDDYECEATVYKHVLSGKSSDRKINASPDNMAHFRSQLPDDFDYEVEAAMERTFDIIAEINSIGHDQSLLLLNDELQKLKECETIIDEDHRTVGVASISVGIESLKQWREVLNDPNHIFLKVPYVEYNARVVHNENIPHENRNLQFQEFIDSITTAIPEFDINDIAVSLPDIALEDIIPEDLNVLDPVTDAIGGADVSEISSVVVDAAAASGLNLVPIVSKDILGGSFGALISLNRRKKKNGILVEGINLFLTATSSAVAGSVVGFFEALTQLISPSECA